jgi:hypothetical protein
LLIKMLSLWSWHQITEINRRVSCRVQEIRRRILWKNFAVKFFCHLVYRVRSHTHTHTHTHTPHTHTLMYMYTHALSHTSLVHYLAHINTPKHKLSHTYTITLTITLSHSIRWIYTHTLTNTNTHTHISTHSFTQTHFN